MSFEELALKPRRRPAPMNFAAGLEASPEFIEKLPYAIYASDAAGRLLWFNSRAAQLWGRTPLIGEDDEHCWSSAVSVNGRPVARGEFLASVLRTGMPMRGTQAKIAHADGTCFWASVHIEPVEDEDGIIAGAISSFPEMSASRAGEESHLTETYEQAGVGIAEVDAKAGCCG